MKLNLNDVPKLINDFWQYKNPGILLDSCAFLNDEHESSDQWGEIAVYLCKDFTETRLLYIALAKYQGSLTARELDQNEINFLIDGILPEQPDHLIKNVDNESIT